MSEQQLIDRKNADIQRDEKMKQPSSKGIMPHRTRSPISDLHQKYGKVVENLRKSPRNVNCYIEIFCKILKPYAETRGELLVSDDGKEIYFTRDGTPLTDFGAIPLSVIHRFSEAGKEDWLELLILSKEVHSKIITVRAKDLTTAQWIEDLGVDYIYEKQAVWSIKILIQAMAKYAPVREEFLYSGWATDGRGFYIMCGCKLCADDWVHEQAKITCNHTWKMLDVASHSLTFVLLSIAVLSLFQSKMVRRGVYFKGVCCITAPTQSFKTTIASLFFDFDQGREADVNFEATMPAIVRTIGNTRDSTVILDDYKPGATKAECRDMLQKISTVIRLCSDDSGGIKRAGVQNETVSNIARCLVVVTAEHIHFDVQSTLARLLILELNGKNVDKDKLTYFQENHAIYRECIENFLKYIIRYEIDRFCEHFAQRFLRERNMLRVELSDQELPIDNRTSDMCTWLHIAFSEFLQYALSVKTITQGEFEKYEDESKSVFLSLMQQQSERVMELDGIRLFFKGLQILLETKEVHIGTLRSRNVNYAATDSRSAIGFRKKGFVYLKNDVAFQKVVSYFQCYGRDFTFSEVKLRKRLADRGCINRKDGKTYIHRLSVNHESYQCMQFDESKFDMLLIGGQGNGSESEKEVSSDWGLRQNANAILG